MAARAEDANKGKATLVGELEPTDLYFDARMAHEVTAFGSGLAEARVAINLSFTRLRCEISGSEWLSLACSGVWLKLSTTAGKFTDYTKPVDPVGTGRVTAKDSITAGVKHSSIEVSASQATERGSVDFQTEVQAGLSASLTASEDEVIWTFELNRSPQTVRDCLDGNKHLHATMTVTGPGGLTLECAPVDVRVLDAKNRPLSLLATVGLLLKLKKIARVAPKKRTYVSHVAAPLQREVG